ncbi:hypothetical protein K2173_024126 [Erythroxylum novogranatense]|uniref:DUF761 domain-containing protein n=1 Tax=Erythroxylum novogranatense TaxID=1862640 RepID=A0AAV8UEP9_9ROSI|nr:hypothetical protein K2173_024126 [Erythroxylum novogranatense]
MVTLQVFATRSSLPSSTLCSMKIKTLIQTLILSHVNRIFKALSKAKSILTQILKELQPLHLVYPESWVAKKKQKDYRKIFFGSFRLHYNWCSSHVLPVSQQVLEGFSTPHLYYDPTWNSVITTHEQFDVTAESQLSGYFHWLEQKRDESSNGDHGKMNEIDQLADIFIASCHERFMLEKQESYRRFQEMMARSI